MSYPSGKNLPFYLKLLAMMDHTDILHWDITNLLETMVPSNKLPISEERNMQHEPEVSCKLVSDNEPNVSSDFIGFGSIFLSGEPPSSLDFEGEEDETNESNELSDFYREIDELYPADVQFEPEIVENPDPSIKLPSCITIQNPPKNPTILLPCKHVFEYTDILPYLLALSRTQIHSFQNSSSFSLTCPTCKTAYDEETEKENRLLQKIPSVNYIQTINPPTKIPLYDIFPTAPPHLQADGSWHIYVQPSFWGGKVAAFARLNIEQYESTARRAYEQLPQLLALQRTEQRLERVRAAAKKGNLMDMFPAKVVPCEALGVLTEREEDLEGRFEEARAQVARMLILFAEHGGACLVGSFWEGYEPIPRVGGSGMDGWI